MKLLELDIRYVRGIHTLELTPNGNNQVIWGPNGSGKSAVVDAVDFLLTGQISRLAGRGAGELSLTQHGPHVDHTEEEATVTGIFRVPGVPAPLKLSRCFSDPGTLAYDHAYAANLEPILALARRGQHVLSRREILKYIWAEAGTRAEQIQELLNLKDVEDIRQALVRAEHDLARELTAAIANVEKARSELNGALQLTTFDLAAVIAIANQNRVLVGGQKLAVLSSATLKSNIKAPTVITTDQGVNVTFLQRDIRTIAELFSTGNEQKLATADTTLRAILQEVRADPGLTHELSHRELIEQGLALLDETGRCPLCDTEWPAGKLLEHLQAKLATAENATQYANQVRSSAKEIADLVNRLRTLLARPIAATQALGAKEPLQELQSWLSQLDSLSTALAEPLRYYPQNEVSTDQVRQLHAPSNILHSLDQLSTSAAQKFPTSTPEQNAWDLLTQLEIRLDAVEKATSAADLAQLYQSRAAILLDAFLKSRDQILESLYSTIRDRFVHLYQQLHAPDEADFSATIAPEGAALRIQVDFHGRGPNPPHALHSEGHQDSMGVCLFLALAEHLTAGLMDLVILDDVIMSVDADHRRRLCELLATEFPNRQLLITTHDRSWATQLRVTGIVDRKGSIEFFNWSIDTGPQVNYEAEMWARIAKQLAANDVTGVAGTLRRGLEEFFAFACDALHAPLTFRLSRGYELGDFLPAAASRYLKLIAKAKKAALSWGKNDVVDELDELRSVFATIYNRTNAEQWVVNKTLHYDQWVNSTPNDMNPIVEAMRDLQLQLTCSSCGGLLRVTEVAHKDAELRCSCDKLHWNLLGKGDAPPALEQPS